MRRGLRTVFLFLVAALCAQNLPAQPPRVLRKAPASVRWQVQGPVAADFNNDGTVGFADFLLFVRSFNTRSGDAGFDGRMDLNGDGSVNLSDFLSFSAAYGTQVDVEPPGVGYAVYVLDSQIGAALVFDSESHLIFDYLPLRGPTGIRISKDERRIYISEAFGLFVLDEKHEVLFSVPTRSQGRIVLSPDERLAYVTEQAQNRLLVVDLAAETAIDTIPVGQTPIDLEITPDGKKLYVVNFNSRDISVIDLERRERVGTIVIGGATPAEIGITADGKRAYVTNIDRGVISVLDLVADRVVGGIQLSGEQARGLAFSPDGKVLYVASQAFLLAVDVQRNLISKRLRVGDATSTIGISPDGSRAYIGTLVLQGGGPGVTAVDLVEWRVLGRMLGVDFISDIGFRRMAAGTAGKN